MVVIMSSLFKYSQENFDMYKASFRKRYPYAPPGVLEQIVNLVIVSNPASVIDGTTLAHMAEGIYLLGKNQADSPGSFNPSSVNIRDNQQGSFPVLDGRLDLLKQ
jgi:hypothetical protein